MRKPLTDTARQKPVKRQSGAVRALKTLLKIVIWLLVIAVVVFLVMFAATKIGEFDSIPEMLDYVWGQINTTFGSN